MKTTVLKLFSKLDESKLKLARTDLCLVNLLALYSKPNFALRQEETAQLLYGPVLVLQLNRKAMLEWEGPRLTDRRIKMCPTAWAATPCVDLAVSQSADRTAHQPASGKGWEGEDYGVKNYSFLHPTTNRRQLGVDRGYKGLTECRLHMQYFVVCIFIQKTHF